MRHGIFSLSYALVAKTTTRTKTTTMTMTAKTTTTTTKRRTTKTRKRMTKRENLVESIPEIMQKLELAGLQTVSLVKITTQKQPQ